MIVPVLLGILAIMGLIGIVRLISRLKPAMQREGWQPEDRIEPVDQALLEAAEKEVRGRGSDPEEETAGDDWGPGTGRDSHQ